MVVLQTRCSSLHDEPRGVCDPNRYLKVCAKYAAVNNDQSPVRSQECLSVLRGHARAVQRGAECRDPADRGRLRRARRKCQRALCAQDHIQCALRQTALMVNCTQGISLGGCPAVVSWHKECLAAENSATYARIATFGPLCRPKHMRAKPHRLSGARKHDQYTLRPAALAVGLCCWAWYHDAEQHTHNATKLPLTLIQMTAGCSARTGTFLS